MGYNGEFHQVKRKETKSWVNWGMFYQVWLKVKEQEGVYKADYTVKVDADAVFIPQRLRMYLGSTIKGDSPHGLYLENCQNVQYGFFGHLEVISREGARVLTSNLEECHSLFAPCANEGCDWKWEEQEVECAGLFAAKDCDISPLQEASGLLQVFERGVWPGLCLGRCSFSFLPGVSVSLHSGLYPAPTLTQKRSCIGMSEHVFILFDLSCVPR